MPMLLMFSQNAIIPIVPSMGPESWWPALVGVVQATCPELTYIIRAQSVNRANWLNLLQSNRLGAPFVVIETEEDSQEDWGTDNMVYRQPVNLYYVASTTTASAQVDGGGYDATKFVEYRALALRNSIVTYTGSGFQILNDYPTVNTSNKGLGNVPMYLLQANYQVSQVNASLLWGYGNTDINNDIWKVT